MPSTPLNSFGSIMEGRNYEGDTSLRYRFGFNGKEKLNEIYGDGNAVDYGSRIVNSRIARWFSVDFHAGKFPSQSPFNYLGNNPIIFVDPDGNEIRLWGIADPQSAPVVQFKEIVENRFNGLVTVNLVKSETPKKWDGVTKDKKGYPVMSSQTYYKVELSINEAQIRSFAISSLPTDATPQQIDEQIKVYRQQLLSDDTYMEVNKMTTSPIVANYTLTNYSFGGYAGMLGGKQALGMGNISYLDNVEDVGAFSLLLHEIVEGYNYAAVKGNRKSTSEDLKYGPSHIKAINAQCKDLGIDYMTSGAESSNGVGGGDPWQKNNGKGGTFTVSLYKKLTSGQYQKTTYNIQINNEGNLIPTGDNFSTKTTDTISAEQFESEKAEYETSAKKVK